MALSAVVKAKPKTKPGLTKLQRLSLQNHKHIINVINALWFYNRSQMEQVFTNLGKNLKAHVVSNLLRMPEINYTNYLAYGIDRQMRGIIESLVLQATGEIIPIVERMHRDIKATAVLGMAWIARVAQPPWKPVRINLAKVGLLGSPSSKSPRKGSTSYFMQRLESLVLDQVRIGVRVNETPNQIGKRVQRLFMLKPLKTKEQGYDWSKVFGNSGHAQDPTDVMSQDFGDPATLTQGTFQPGYVQDLVDQQNKAMGWQARQQTQNNQAQWQRNSALQQFERDMMTTVTQDVSDGMLQIGSDNMGIDDFTWLATRAKDECEACLDRDGKDFSDIQDKFDDEYGDQPPPLHPNCRCQLVPKLADDWADSALSKQSAVTGQTYAWDDETGETFDPDSNQAHDASYDGLTFSDWMDTVKNLKP